MMGLEAPTREDQVLPENCQMYLFGIFKFVYVRLRRWNLLTWLFFIPWLLFGVFVNLPTHIGSLSDGAYSLQIGWPWCHTVFEYPADAATFVSCDISVIKAIVDLGLFVLVQVSIVAVFHRIIATISLRSLFLLVAFVAVVIASGRNLVADELDSVVEVLILAIYYGPVLLALCVYAAARLGRVTTFEGLTRAAVFVAVAGLGLTVFWEYIPGTFHLNSQGFPRGTGKRSHYYECGALLTEEWYRAGILTKVTWYRPEGSTLGTERYDVATGGVFYSLRENGNIECRMPCSYSPTDRMFVADGTVTYYAPDGRVERVVEYRNGVTDDKREKAIDFLSEE